MCFSCLLVIEWCKCVVLLGLIQGMRALIMRLQEGKVGPTLPTQVHVIRYTSARGCWGWKLASGDSAFLPAVNHQLTDTLNRE